MKKKKTNSMHVKIFITLKCFNIIIIIIIKYCKDTTVSLITTIIFLYYYNTELLITTVDLGIKIRLPKSTYSN